ncbi:MAG: excinuclease ABC subunit UvrA [Candidatus Abyssobacteria bacterium SURF_17]|uniref:UvrABC system protein A n=1 Tax=Candidatus Abyssobacteria bacterium SURF_17 TaxID=2093361 RepID=A0A419F9M3_9BACT|nr:MAG: excinuclease ABC subunit UvrA [Candidatus Abyssubacteria bacterium SURF_17]
MSIKERAIRFRGIRVHNLKNINLDVAHGKMTVITGVSGSGKSSLAFDTIYAEGQRRYVESLSAYARQFLEKMDKPELDSVEGIPPAIAIQQSPPTRSSRSTVGTATEIHDYLRLLFARIGQVHCQNCRKPVLRHSVEDICEYLNAFSGKRAFIVAPMGNSDEFFAEKAAELRKRGFARVILDGRPLAIEEAVAAPPPQGTEWGLVIDRLSLNSGTRSRLADSLELAYTEGQRRLEIRIVDGPVLRFTNRHICSECGAEYDDPFPQLFSFNSPLGACAECKGFGNIVEIDMDLVVPDKRKSLDGGAIKPWTFPTYDWPMERLRQIAPKEKLPLDVPFKDLSERHVRLLMEGKGRFPGIRRFFELLETKKYKVHVRVLLSRFRGYVTCHKCNGTRLTPQALAVKVQDLTIADVCQRRISSALEFFENVKLTRQQSDIAAMLLKEIQKRLRYLIDVGLDYLTLDRLTRTLSGGEAQRISLASCLGSGLTETLYILDEPSIGMHPRDNAKLIDILKRLRDAGNTVLVVEHDADMISAADEVVDLGPGAGEHGGTVVFQGPVARLKRSRRSLTGKYLSGRKKVGVPQSRHRSTHRLLRIVGAREYNLKNINVDIPVTAFTCITGVSGSGKSTLLENVLYRFICRQWGVATEKPGLCDTILGLEYIDRAVLVDQSPIGRTPRSNPVTYMHAFTEIRNLFASTVSAQLRQLTPSDFSFNVPQGRCQKCKGEGVIKVEMQFFADVYVTCDACDGKRFKPSILEVRYKGKNIHDVLNMTVHEALSFFDSLAALKKRLRVLADTGLGYLRLGQPATTLSGGEAQRLKLASYIAEGGSSRTLFIFDEPTTGLHFNDVAKLVDCFNALVDMGNTVVVIEHNMEVIKCADYIIDLGPEGGDEGGEVVACGSPEAVMNVKRSHTGQFLKKYLSNGQPSRARKRG